MLLLGLLGCGAAPEPWWIDALEADGPCYRVDLLDGLDTESTAEIHDLYACLERNGELRAFAPFDEALEAPVRSGDPAGIALARAVGALSGADLDPFVLSSVLLDALKAPDRPFDRFVDLSLELTYGASAADVRSGLVAVDDPEALQRGVVAPMREVVPIVGRTLLDDDLAATRFLGEIARHPDTKRFVRTLSAVIASPDPAIADPLRAIVPHAGDAIAATRSPANDRWAGATGDSLRDLTAFFIVRDNPVVEAISPDAHQILDDPAFRAALPPTIDALAADGHLAALPEAAAWLTSVGSRGQPLDPDPAAGELSALYRFVRLLADNNRPVDCSIDLVVTTLDWQFDNLALATLRLIAQLQPGQVRDLAGLVSDLTGSPITEPLIDLAIDTGICPSFTRQTLDDLRALEALQRPEALALLAGFVALTEDLQGGPTDHLPAFADLIEALFVAGGLEPTEELVRDLGQTEVAADLVALLSVLIHPEDHDITAGPDPAVTLDELIQIGAWAFAPDPKTGLTGLQRVRPWTHALLDHDDGWRAVGHLALRMSDRGTETADLLARLADLAALDPDLVVFDEIGQTLADPAIATPLLQLAEQPAVASALLADRPPPGHDEVPLALWGRLVTTGALEDLLRFVDAVVGALGAR